MELVKKHLYQFDQGLFCPSCGTQIKKNDDWACWCRRGKLKVMGRVDALIHFGLAKMITRKVLGQDIPSSSELFELTAKWLRFLGLDIEADKLQFLMVNFHQLNYTSLDGVEASKLVNHLGEFDPLRMSPLVAHPLIRLTITIKNQCPPLMQCLVCGGFAKQGCGFHLFRGAEDPCCKAPYCSPRCQKEDWPMHKLMYHHEPSHPVGGQENTRWLISTLMRSQVKAGPSPYMVLDQKEEEKEIPWDQIGRRLFALSNLLFRRGQQVPWGLIRTFLQPQKAQGVPEVQESAFLQNLLCVIKEQQAQLRALGYQGDPVGQLFKDFLN